MSSEIAAEEFWGQEVKPLFYFPILTFALLFRRSSDGEGADPAAEEFFELAEEAVASKRSSRVGIDSKPGDLSLVYAGIQLHSPLVIRDHAKPLSQVQQFRLLRWVNVDRRTGPLIAPWLATELGPNRIKLDVSHGKPEMPLIQRTRIETPLPKVAAAPMKAIDILRISKVSSAYGLGKRVLGPRYPDNLNVIGHETITDDFQAVLAGLLGEQLQIHAPIIIYKEDVLTIIPALGDMMSTPGHDCPC